MCCLVTWVGVDGEDERPEAEEETGKRREQSGCGGGRRAGAPTLNRPEPHHSLLSTADERL